MKIIILLLTIILCASCARPQTKRETLRDPSFSSPSPSPSPTPEASPSPAPFEEPAAQRVRLSRAATPLLDKSESRINNINLAAEKINSYILAPFEVFSFNNSVGARTEEKGYEKAATIINGEKEYDYGGGVCQLATTVFQAADAAGLKIIERHNHNKDIGYAESGQDAAVNYDTLDMKFQNTMNFSIMIAVLVGENEVIAEIYRTNY